VKSKNREKAEGKSGKGKGDKGQETRDKGKVKSEE
jgi:hypothetical protein